MPSRRRRAPAGAAGRHHRRQVWPAMNVFAGTAGYYDRYRPGIPDAVAEVLAAAAPARRPRRLLDIGTGTGQVVAALLTRFDDIIAIDADPDMLATAGSSLRPRLPAGTRMRLQRCTAEEFTTPTAWRADLVTICRAFHWLDQPVVLHRLDGQVAAHGAVAVFADSSFWTGDSTWTSAIRDVVRDFLGEQRRAGAGVFGHRDRPYSEILHASPFNHVTELRVPVTRVWSAKTILGYLYSTSFAAPHLFGGRLPAFETAVHQALAQLSDNDTFTEDNQFEILIGRRSRPE